MIARINTEYVRDFILDRAKKKFNNAKRIKARFECKRWCIWIIKEDNYIEVYRVVDDLAGSENSGIDFEKIA